MSFLNILGSTFEFAEINNLYSLLLKPRSLMKQAHMVIRYTRERSKVSDFSLISAFSHLNASKDIFQSVIF